MLSKIIDLPAPVSPVIENPFTKSIDNFSIKA
jgi:hypothetical protein